MYDWGIAIKASFSLSVGTTKENIDHSKFHHITDCTRGIIVATSATITGY